MKIDYENMDKLVRKLREDLDLYITFNDDTGRSIEFEAEKQISEHGVIATQHKISFKRLANMSEVDAELELTNKFEFLRRV